MKNQIFRISKEEKKEIASELQSKGYFTTEIDASSLLTSKKFLAEMGKIFEYSEEIENYNWLDDVMRDLEWLNNDLGYVLFINNSFTIIYPYPEEAPYNFARFLFWMEFWEDEVERVVVGGKKKKFDVYLVD
ncbi:hypothetical protein [Enterococcus termitis]|uniref:Barstar (barnase inhibitor) domain-containing protein n=1 Tax=Enterococcus termitis TaxID=332950 RepID=A0A1E5GCS4_9ENTE|nr:hypothetical protein [Enterococcus termitis]OEG10467.1 hypothetical protein BCR25_08285 [Enterococcus termitis]OJG97448.1 hypothetical protein RV18_GL000729 [Enterococcus termitis]